MNVVRGIRVEGFWLDKTVDVDFFDDVNFLIGVNGSGKTTLINLLSAILRGDLAALYRTSFTKATVRLQARKGRKQPEIQVVKEETDVGGERIVYRIRSQRSSSYEEVVFDEYRDYRRHRNFLLHQPPFRGTDNPLKDINDRLADLVRVSWLSIHRSKWARRADGDDNFDSTVDKKVQELSDDLVKYFVGLRSRADDELKSFQESVFLSLLFNNEAERNIRPTTDISINSQKSSLESIFRQFQVGERKYRTRLNNHFKAVDNASRKLSGEERLVFNEVLALVENDRIVGVTAEWEELQKNLQSIFAPRDDLLKILNTLLVRKRIFFDDRYEATVETQSGKRFRPQVLSSGEKQLFILLGEVVLHEKLPYIFIADEPELSLHVSWQSVLVKNLINLNPNMQLIIATHSPDIVSVFDDKIIDIEKRIS